MVTGLCCPSAKVALDMRSLPIVPGHSLNTENKTIIKGSILPSPISLPLLANLISKEVGRSKAITYCGWGVALATVSLRSSREILTHLLLTQFLLF